MSSKTKESCCCTRKCGMITASVLGVIFVVLGGFLVFIFDSVLENIVKRESVIANNTDAYEAWVAPPPLYFELYVFNVTNPDEFLAGAASGTFVKPQFQELGPYVYREILRKDQLEFLDTEPEELKFRSTGKYYFEPSLSKGKESDTVTTLNIIATGAPSILEYAIFDQGISNVQARALRATLNTMINEAKSELLFTKTVGELFFGFEDELLSLIVNSIELLPIVPDGMELPETFGLFSTMNNSAGWYDYSILTGKEDYSLMNKVASYQGMTELDYWFSDECNMINGTDGTTIPAFTNKDDTMYLFVDDICRTMYATFYAEVDIKGVPGWEFRIPSRLFEAPSKNPENLCWCPDLDLEICKHDGGLALSTCLFGAPVFMTLPHFLFAEHYLQFVEGLNPIEDEHTTPLTYEPNTGICTKADKRLQISLYLTPFEDYDILNGAFQENYAFPILWLNESYIMSDEDADLMYKYLVAPRNGFFIAQIILCSAGAVLLATVLFYLFAIWIKKGAKEEEEKDSTEKTDKNGVTYDNDTFEKEIKKPVTRHHIYENDDEDIPVTAL